VGRILILGGVCFIGFCIQQSFEKLKACAAHTGISITASCVILPSAFHGGRMPFFKQHPCYLTYFLATAQESKHNMVGNHFEHLKDGPQGEIQGRIS
jgi:hypothetical protein